MAARSQIKGFTLLELLVAITIFAIVAIMAMGGFNQLVRQRSIAATTMERVRNLQRCVTRMSQDLEQLSARPIRDATSAIDIPALSVGNDGVEIFEFSRAGWSNPTGLNRSTLQRVRYRLVDHKLYRDYWPVLDRTLNTVPVQVQLLDKVSNVTVRYMDNTGQWQSTWPPGASSSTNTNTSNGNPTANYPPRYLPIAIEFTLTLEDWGDIKRIVEVPTL